MVMAAFLLTWSRGLVVPFNLLILFYPFSLPIESRLSFASKSIISVTVTDFLSSDIISVSMDHKAQYHFGGSLWQALATRRQISLIEVDMNMVCIL